MNKLAVLFAALFCALPARAQNAITLPYAAQSVADIGNGPIKVRVTQGNASIFTAQGFGVGATSGLSTALVLTATPATPPLVGGLVSGAGITSGTTVAAYDGTTGVTLSSAMTVSPSTAISWGAACPSSAAGIPSRYIQASVSADYYLLYTQARVCAISPGGPANTLLVLPIFYDATSLGVMSFNSRNGVVIPILGDYSFSLITGNWTLAQSVQFGANQIMANVTGGAAQPTLYTMPACANDGLHALTYTNGSGFICSSNAPPSCAADGTHALTFPAGAFACTSLSAPATPNIRSITATAAVSNASDCATGTGTISAAGGSYYSITSSGSYTTGCVVTIFNADPIPNGTDPTGAKFVSFVDCTTNVSGTYVYPQDSIEVQYNGSAWIPKRCPGLWMAPGGIFDINIDPGSGSDTWGVSDGLATGSRAFASVNIASYVTANLMRGNFRNATEFTYKLCASCTDSVTWHWPAHGAPTNSQGRAGVTLDCNSGTMSGGIQLFFGGSILKIQNCTVQNGVSLSEGAEIIIMGPSPQANQFDTVSGSYTFTCTMGSKIFDGTSGGQVNMGGGSGTGFINASTGCNASFGTGMVVVAPITYSDATIHIQAGSFVSWGNYGGSAITGKKFNVIECGIIEGSANVPGSIAGTATCIQVN